MTQQHYALFQTAAGFCGLTWNEAGISRFQLPAPTEDEARRFLLRKIAGAEPGRPNPEISAAIAAIIRYFAGEKMDFSEIALDLRDQDEFFSRIYAAARQIGWGETTTYGALARQLGAGPEAARDVGQAMAKNPVALIIPCHRVLAAGGKLGGFSAPGGSASKARMLELEGVRLQPPKPPQASFLFGS